MLLFLDIKYIVQIYVNFGFMMKQCFLCLRCRCKVWEPIHNALLHSSRRMLRPHQKLGLQGLGAPLARELGRAQSQRPLDGEERVRERGGDQDLVCAEREGRRGTQQRFAHEGWRPELRPRPTSLLERGAQAQRASRQSTRVSVASNLTRYANGKGESQKKKKSKNQEEEEKKDTYVCQHKHEL